MAEDLQNPFNTAKNNLLNGWMVNLIEYLNRSNLALNIHETPVTQRISCLIILILSLHIWSQIYVIFNRSDWEVCHSMVGQIADLWWMVFGFHSVSQKRKENLIHFSRVFFYLMEATNESIFRFNIRILFSRFDSYERHVWERRQSSSPSSANWSSICIMQSLIDSIDFSRQMTIYYYIFLCITIWDTICDQLIDRNDFSLLFYCHSFRYSTLILLSFPHSSEYNNSFLYWIIK